MKETRPFHTHECKRCQQPYACNGQPEGLPEVTCVFYRFPNWDHCPSCVNVLWAEEARKRLSFSHSVGSSAE